MKNLMYIFLLIFLCSCGKDDIEFPSTYSFESGVITFYTPYILEGGVFTEIDRSEATEPIFPDDVLGSIHQLRFLDEDMVEATDSFGTETVEYEGDKTGLSITFSGQKIEFFEMGNVDHLSYSTIASVTFDDGEYNSLVSAICGEFANCSDIDEDEWLDGLEFLGEGQIVYIVTKEETLRKE